MMNFNQFARLPSDTPAPITSPSLDWRCIDGTINEKAYNNTPCLFVYDKNGTTVDVLIFENDKPKRYLQGTKTAKAIILGDLANAQSHHIIAGVDNALLLQIHQSSYEQVCVICVPFERDLAFVVQAFAIHQPLSVYTTADKQSNIADLPINANLYCTDMALSDLYRLSDDGTQVLMFDEQTSIDDFLGEPIELVNAETQLQAKVTLLKSTVERLAQMDEYSLELTVRPTAKKLGLPYEVLKKYVADRQNAKNYADTKPYHQAVSSDELYNELYHLIDKHITIDEPQKVAFVFWVIFSYLVDIANIAPIAWITAPEKQCGKSTLLSLFARLVNKPLATSSITPASLFRVADKYKPTVLLDEIDVSVKKNQEILGIINAGYSRHAPYIVRYDTDAKTERFFNCFCAKVASGIGSMQGTFMSRSIRFEMRRQTNQDKDTEGLNEQDLPQEQTDKLKSKIARWANDNRQAVKAVRIVKKQHFPKLNDRDFDNWYILLQIATVMGKFDTAKIACLAITQKPSEPSLNEELLADIREQINVNHEYISCHQLCDDLTMSDTMRWRTYHNGQPITVYWLGKRLSKFGIKSENKRLNGELTKCYKTADLLSVFEMYLKPLTPPNIDEIFE